MTASEDVDLSAIAAFIDGRLSGAERDRVAKLIAESDEAFEVYAGAVGARSDIGGGESVISLTERRDSRPRRWWVAAVPVAAAAALLIAVLPRMQGRGGDAANDLSTAILSPLISPSTVRPLVAQSTPGTASGSAQLAVALGSGWDEQRWSVTRGSGATLVDSVAALRLGVRATDLQVALTLGDREHARRIAAEMVELLRPLNLSDSQRADYGVIATRITGGDSVEQIATVASDAEKSLGEFLNSRWFGLGKWFAAGELAARAHSVAFFKSTETTRFLESAVKRDRLGSEDVRLLQDVEGFVARGVAQGEFEAVQQKFAELIRRHGG
jgi:hypothetical protein